MSSFITQRKDNKFKIQTWEDIEKMPPPEWLIYDTLPKGCLTMMFGAPGSGKSFIALDMSLCIASDTKWKGYDVKPGRVIYIYGEGGRGIKKRTKAWSLENKKERVDNIHFISTAPNLLDSKDVRDVIDAIDLASSESPTLIVIDTLARAIPGANENDSNHMGLAIQKCEEIQNYFDASVMLIHHSGKTNKKQERGSSSLGGAIDTRILIEKPVNSKSLTMSCTKQKDDEEFENRYFNLVVIDIDDENSSCVIEIDERTGNDVDSYGSSSRIRPNENKILNYLYKCGGYLARWSEIKEGSDVAPGSFDKTLNNLDGKGLIQKTTDGSYRLTKKAITIIKPSNNHHDGSNHQPLLLSHP